MKERLKLEISKIGNYGLSIKVVHQSGDLKEKGIILSNGRKNIRIYNRPELTEDSLYLRGVDTGSDNCIVTRLYQTVKQRDEMYDFVSLGEKILNGKAEESLLRHSTLKITKGDCFYVNNTFVQYLDESVQTINLCPVVTEAKGLSGRHLKLLPTIGDNVPEKSWEYAGNVLLDNQKAA